MRTSKFRTDLWDHVLDDWKLKQQMIFLSISTSRWLFLSSRLVLDENRSCNLAVLANAGLYIAFKHSVSFAMNLAANFGCYQIRIMPEIVSKLCMQPSEVVVLFNGNLSWCPFLWTDCWFKSAALHSIWFGTCWFGPMPYFHSGTKCMIKRLSQAMRAAWTKFAHPK